MSSKVWEVHKNDVRIHKIDLDKQKPKSTKMASTPKNEGTRTVELEWCESKERVTRIDRLVERAYLFNSELSTKKIWAKILAEFQDKENCIDTDSTIEYMDLDSIEWFTKVGGSKQFLYKSFENKISLIRKYYSNK